MEETDEIKGLRERLSDDRKDSGDDLLRTIESDSWEHLRATTDMESTFGAATAPHEVPRELLDASMPTSELPSVVPRDDDPRWLHTAGRMNDDGSIELPDEVAKRIEPGSRVHIKVFIDD